MASYQVRVQDIALRNHEITTKAAASGDRRHFQFIYSTGETLPVITVDLGLPVYRMENYRTNTRQRSSLRRNDLPPEFFSAGQEDVAAQQAQHDILADLAFQGRGESIMAVSDALRIDRVQTEPLLVTRDGVVVNGNRRLAAMRELYASSPSDFQSFRTIQVQVLPADVMPEELVNIEVRLQSRPETKLPYDWTDTAILVRDMREAGKSPAEIARLMWRRESEVQALIASIMEAETFLEQYLGTPGEYADVEEHEQQFDNLQKALRSKRTAMEQECSRAICHVMTKHSREFGRRVHDYRDAFGDRAVQVMERLATRRGISLADDGNRDGQSDDDLFGGGDGGTATRFAAVRDVLVQRDESQAIARDIKEIYDEIKEESREDDLSRAALKSAERANTALMQLSLAQADPATYAGIRAQLDSITSRAQSIRDELLRRES